MKERGNILLVMVAVGLFVSGLAGYFYWSSFVKTSADKQKTTSNPVPLKEPDNKSTVEKTTISSEEKDEMANWKTYTDKQYRYQLQYPSDWEWTAPAEPTAVNIFSQQTRPAEQDKVHYVVEVRMIEPSPSQITPSKLWYQEWTKKIPAGAQTQYFKFQEINAHKFSILIVDQQSGYGDLNAYFYHEGFLFRAYFFSSGKFDQKSIFQGQNLFKQILSTFKFLEQTKNSLNSYTACGCGCCVGITPQEACLYKTKGESLEKVMERDLKAKNYSQCAMVGCSRGTTYRYCD